MNLISKLIFRLLTSTTGPVVANGQVTKITGFYIKIKFYYISSISCSEKYTKKILHTPVLSVLPIQ